MPAKNVKSCIQLKHPDAFATTAIDNASNTYDLTTILFIALANRRLTAFQRKDHVERQEREVTPKFIIV